MANKINKLVIFLILMVILAVSVSATQMIKVPLPDDRYRWDEWDTTDTLFSEKVLKQASIYSGDDVPKIDVNVNGDFDPTIIDYYIDVNGDLLPDPTNSSLPANWTSAGVGASDSVNYANNSLFITGGGSGNVYWINENLDIPINATVLACTVKSDVPFYIQIRNSTGSYEYSRQYFPESSDYITYYVSWTNKDTVLDILFKQFNQVGTTEVTNISVFNGDYDTPANWSKYGYYFSTNKYNPVEKEVTLTVGEMGEQGYYNYSIGSLDAGTYELDYSYKGTSQFYVRLYNESSGLVIFTSLNRPPESESVYQSNKIYYILDAPTNLSLRLYTYGLDDDLRYITFKNITVKKLDMIDYGKEFTAGYRLFTFSINNTDCNGVDTFCGGGHMGDNDIELNYNYMSHDFLQVVRTANNLYFNSSVFYTYDYANHKVYEDYYFTFNSSKNVADLRDRSYAGMQTVRNIKETSEIWTDGVLHDIIYLNRTLSERSVVPSNSVQVVRANASNPLHNYSYIYRTDIQRQFMWIPDYADLDGYNKKYFEIHFVDDDYGDIANDGLSLYVHWDTVVGDEISTTQLTDTWAPDAIIYKDGAVINLNPDPDAQVELNGLTITSTSPVNVELREFGNLVESDRLYGIVGDTEIYTEAGLACRSISEQIYDSFNIGAIALIILVASLLIGILMTAFGGAGFDSKTLMAGIATLVISAILFIVGVIIFGIVSGTIC